MPPKERISLQRITGVDEERRLVGSISANRAYFADSTNSIAPKKKGITLCLLGLLNSNLLNWRFSLTSTNNNLGTNELEVLPVEQKNKLNSTIRFTHEDLRLMCFDIVTS